MNEDLPVPEHREKPSSTKRKRLLLLIGILLVLVLGDWLLRNLEMKALVGNMEESEAAMVAAADSLRRVSESHSRGISGLNPLTEQRRMAWIAALEKAASEGAGGLIPAGAPIREMIIMPWHRAIQRARDHYVKHHEAWEKFLTDVARNGEKIDERRPQIEGTFKIAERSAKKAVPPLPLFELRDRVIQIFQE